jgi:CubicO group peptidase (beta-lactamase class C family)
MNIVIPEEVGLSSTISRPGIGYGLGFGVHVGPARTKALGSKGTFFGSGHDEKNFWVDPDEALIGLIMPQVLDYSGEYHGLLRELASLAVME